MEDTAEPTTRRRWTSQALVVTRLCSTRRRAAAMIQSDDNNQRCLSVVRMNQIVSDTILCLLFHNHPRSFWPGLAHGIRPGAKFNDLLFKIAVRSSRLCILVSGLLGASVTTFNLYRKCRKGDLCFSELMHGRMKLMTAVCPAWAHTYQSMCLGYRPSQLRPWNFRLLRPKNKFGELPTCRSSTWTAGIECDGWRLFTDGGTKQSEGADGVLRR